MMQIKAVESKKDLNRFIDFVYDHYENARYFIPPLRLDLTETLNPKKNPFFEHGKIQCFLAEENGKIIGRIAAVINGMHLQKYNDGNGFFGFFECVERPEVAKALFDAAENWLKAQGLSGMRGPANPSMNDVAGLLVDGFDREPSIMMPYNYDYYEKYLLDNRFERVQTMWAYYIHQKYRRDMVRLKRGNALIFKRNPGLKLRTIDMSRFDEEAQIILDIYNDAWSENWGHVSMTPNEFKHLASAMKQILDPKVIYILELNGKPIAFSITLPDLNKALRHVKRGRLLPFGIFKLLWHSKFHKIDTGRTLLMGVLKEYQGRGFDVVVNLAICEDGVENAGYEASEMSWLLDSNKPMVNAAINLGGVKDKEYAMFEKRF